MPVPVPLKQPAHPVFKKTQVITSIHHGNPLHSLTSTLPGSPDIASFGTREQWISSLPSWRRCKPRCIQDNAEGLSRVPAPETIKGPLSPPLGTTAPRIDVPVASSDIDVHKQDAAMHYLELSPFQPQTPFADFIDRAIAAPSEVTQPISYPSLLEEPDPMFQQNPPSVPMDAFPTAQQVVTPTATTGYKKLAAPLSEWMANFIWKACSTDLALPSTISRLSVSPYKPYPASAPPYIASSVHSLLLSTLLQPSAVLLALWYIVRLPISFGGVPGASTQKESEFRDILFGSESGLDCETQETNAPFKLIVLGCMLANKWLDDHTFSNKTWHTISSVPIVILNKLESLTLEIFQYDLSVPTDQWTLWLSYLLTYHGSLCSSPHPQPISRPSTNPHSIVRKAIEEIIQAPAACNYDPSNPRPVFIGFDDQRQAKIECETIATIDVDVVVAAAVEIDLDEDGPLREEYLPRRRMSGPAKNPIRSQQSIQVVDENWTRQKTVEIEKSLPPPAKWSPEGDEPILRDRNGINCHYLAVQPPPLDVPFHIQVPLYPNIDYHPSVPTAQWNRTNAMGLGYIIDVPPLRLPTVPIAPTLYNPFGIAVLPIPPHAPSHAHSRSQSLSHTYDPDLSQHNIANRIRSYSIDQHGCEPAMNPVCDPMYRPSLPGHDNRWGVTHHPFPVYDYGYQGVNPSPYAQYLPVDGLNLNYHTSWLRA